MVKMLVYLFPMNIKMNSNKYYILSTITPSFDCPIIRAACKERVCIIPFRLENRSNMASQALQQVTTLCIPYAHTSILRASHDQRVHGPKYRANKIPGSVLMAAKPLHALPCP
mmetsp:Transcript_20424/g.24746  ORF Transcript_20424/g.24746 Transcript_20424/m.24746 type:complete len:113 (+) Transcript_20424:926-1264(+)